MCYYKFNLYYDLFPWFGTRACKIKTLVSPTWLKYVKPKKYPFWRIDALFSEKKYNNIHIVEDGGWHFCNLKTPEQLLYKYNNLCETNDPYIFKEKIDKKYLQLEEIEKRVKEGKDLIGREETYKTKKLDKLFPQYILNNIELYKEWIAN